MAYYKIIHKILPDGVVKYFDERLKKLVEGNIINGKYLIFDKKEIDNQELEQIVTFRTSKREKSSTLAFGNPDFWPIAFLGQFLGRGLRCSSAVGRLVRDYSSSEVEKENLLQQIQSSGYKKEEINQILSLGDNSIWGEYDLVSQALEDKEVQKRFKDHLNLNKVPFGTGFLVGKNYLLTNHHILNKKEVLEDFKVQFLYEQDYLGRKIEAVEYKLDSVFFETNEGLDYSLIKVQPLGKEEHKELTFREAGDNFGWLPMFEDDKVIAPPYNLPLGRKDDNVICQLVKYNMGQIDSSELGRYDRAGEAVIIIQHPKGRRKEIVVFNNKVQKLYNEFLQYETETDLGSSGSPVLNQQWQLVGLHHSALVDRNDNRIVGHLGTRIKSIVKDLQGKAKDREIQSFLDNFVVTKGKIQTRGRIYILANHVKDEPPLELAMDAKLRWNKNIKRWAAEVFPEEVERELSNPNAAEQIILLRDQIISELKYWKDKYSLEIIPVVPNIGADWKDAGEAIGWINQHEYKVGDVALQIYMSNSPQQVSRRGASAFYIANKADRKVHAELLLQSLFNQVPDLPNQGAESDQATKDDGFDFCRDLMMPSLRMRVGYATNPEDWKIITNGSTRQNMAKGIANGLIAWVNSLSPIVMFDD